MAGGMLNVMAASPCSVLRRVPTGVAYVVTCPLHVRNEEVRTVMRVCL
jgi:hypothetical protein